MPELGAKAYNTIKNKFSKIFFSHYIFFYAFFLSSYSLFDHTSPYYLKKIYLEIFLFHSEKLFWAQIHLIFTKYLRNLYLFYDHHYDRHINLEKKRTVCMLTVNERIMNGSSVTSLKREWFVFFKSFTSQVSYHFCINSHLKHVDFHVNKKTNYLKNIDFDHGVFMSIGKWLTIVTCSW